MKRNRKSSIRKERVIMLASSAFVLAALTMTGLYMKGQEIKEQDDGYTLDFTVLENGAGDKMQEDREAEQDMFVAKSTANENLGDDLDYMPLEAGSSIVSIPGLTDHVVLPEEAQKPEEESVKNQQKKSEKSADEVEEEALQESASPSVEARELHFSEEEKIVRPVEGNVILPYSMDASVYFATLDQYKYNPATIFGAEEGTVVASCTDGRVVSVFDNEEIGHAVAIDIGDGYQVIYGQLTDIRVHEGSYVDAGDSLGTVAAPTKYYVSEGSNLYFQIKKDGQPINPENLL